MTKETTQKKKDVKASKKKVEEVEVPTKLPRRVVVYGYLVIQTILLIVYGSASVASCSGSPDPRSKEQIVEDYFHRRIDAGASKMDHEDVSQKKIKLYVKAANGILRDMKMHRAGNPEVVFDTECPESEWYTKEERKNKGCRYHWQPNFGSYVRTKRYEDAIQTIKAMKEHPDYKDRISWLKMSAEEFMNQPFCTVKNADGSVKMTGKDPHGKQEDSDYGTPRPVTFLCPLAEEITKRNAIAFKETGEEFRFQVAFRGNFEQAVSIWDIAGKDWRHTRKKVMMPGNSHHNMHLAADIYDRQKHGEYFASIGMVGGCGAIADDEDHFGFAEFAVYQPGGFVGTAKKLSRALSAAACTFK